MKAKVVAKWGGWIIVVLLTFQCVSQAAELAAPLKLRWDAAADPNVRGYAIYYGRTNQVTLDRIDVGSNLACTLSEVYVGVTYRIYAISYNALMTESIPSNELIYTPITPSNNRRLQITRLSNGNMQINFTATTNALCRIQFTTTLTGSSWQNLTNIALNQNGNITVVDTAARFAPQRFYRVILSP